MIRKKIINNQCHLNSITTLDFHSRSQKGMSLIELMISMVIGLFLLAGVVTNFINTKNADVKRNAVSEMDANAQVALNIMRQTITHAGYPSIQNVRMEKAFYTESDGSPLDNPTCRDGSSIKRDKDELKKFTENSGITDILSVISLADNPCITGSGLTCVENPKALVYSDCTGGGATRDLRAVSCSTDPGVGMKDPTEAKIYSSFYVEESEKALYCQGNRADEQPLVENVYALQFLYGVKQDDGKKIYRNATKVEDLDQWGLVNSVQIGLLMQSSDSYILDVDSSTISYILLDEKINIPANQRRHLYRMYNTTVNLENWNKDPL